MHDLRLCISIRFDLNVRLCVSVCVVSVCVFHCGFSAVDVVVVPVFVCAFDVSVLCLCIVAVNFLCHCLSCAVPVLCRVLSVLNSQGHVCQRFYCTYLIDDLESISTLWRRDHLSAIKLLGNLLQTTLAHDDLPSNPTSPLDIMSNSQSYSPDLHIAPKHSGASLA